MVRGKFKSYQVPFILAILLHAVLIIGLMIELPRHQQVSPLNSAQKPPKIVHAVAVNQAAIEKQMVDIKKEQQAKRAEEALRIHKLQQAAKKAKASRLAEQRRVTRLKNQQAKLEREHKAAALKLAQQKRQQALARRQALALKKQRQAQEQALAKVKRELKQKKARELQAQQRALQKKMEQQQLAEEQQRIAKQKKAQLHALALQYNNKFSSVIHQNWLILSHNSKIHVTLLVRVAPGGEVLSATVIKSSGDPSLDRLAQSAVFKSSPLPVPKDPVLFEQLREFTIKMSP